MKKILISGFEPFNGGDINPSQLLVEKLEAPEGVELIKAILPVEFNKTTDILTDLVNEKNPDIILSIGQAGNVPHISVERVALNIDNSKASDGKSVLADASGDAPVDRPIFSDGPDAYLSTLPVWDMVDAVNAVGIPCRMSYSAGTYVCNHAMYIGAILAEKHEIISGFVHVPYLPEQLIGQDNFIGKYSMSLDDMQKALNAIIACLAKA